MIADRQAAGKDSAPLVVMRDALVRISQAFTWRRAGTVFILCLILSTQVFAQPDLFEHWSLERILEGWSYQLAEVCLTGFAMLGGFALVESTSEAEGSRRVVAVSIALPASAALGYALAVALLYSPGFSVFSTQFVGDTLRMSVDAAVELFRAAIADQATGDIGLSIEQRHDSLMS